jgi:hypothetical protein
MSIGWMAFIAALIAIEKLLPWKAAANRGIAVLLAVLGLTVAFAPEDVPGLTLPDSPEAQRAMESMGMEGSSMEPGSGAAGMGESEMQGGGMDESGKAGSGMDEPGKQGSGMDDSGMGN